MARQTRTRSAARAIIRQAVAMGAVNQKSPELTTSQILINLEHAGITFRSYKPRKPA